MSENFRAAPGNPVRGEGAGGDGAREVAAAAAAAVAVVVAGGGSSSENARDRLREEREREREAAPEGTDGRRRLWKEGKARDKREKALAEIYGDVRDEMS